MGGNFERLSDFHAGFDSVIDVRSPAEFAIDHVPGAINLPVLSNDERAEVGTLYVQTSPFEARKIGGALVMKNIAQHLSGVLSDKPRGWKPLVYCWRGGQRSGAMTWALAQVGWKSEQLKGGYKTYRALVKDALYDREMTRPVVLLDGNTGTAKTELLQILAARGVNVLDLEALANHRGSVFGGMAAPQPSQRMFERDILSALEAMPEGPVLVEAESSKVGDRLLPPGLWSAMLGAPRIRIVATLEARAEYLARAYRDILEDALRVKQTLARLVPMIGHKAAQDWSELARDGAFEAFTAALMQHHYDPRYERSRGRGEAETCAEVTIARFDGPGLARAADEIAAAFAAVR